MITYILAGNVAQAALWSREHGYSLSDTRYVAQEHMLRGVKEPHYVVTGTFWDRHDAIKIWQILLAAYAGATVKPLAPPEIQKFLTANTAAFTAIDNPVAPLAVLQPVEPETDITPKKKKFKHIRV
jgi:hypothetical protein